MLTLSEKWISRLVSQPETGMGYHIVTLKLKNGMNFNQVIVDSGFITRIKGISDIPFKEDDIQDIIVTHDKWDFDRE